MKQTGWLNRALAACAAALALCGCQATPDAPIVVGKDNEAMIELALATPAPGAADTPEAGAPDAPEAGAAEDYAALCARYGCPERWQASFTEADGRLTVQADVAVDLPGTGDMPLARVHAERFEQALVSSLFAALCGETPMYFLPEERPRSAIEADIESMQQRLRELDAGQLPGCGDGAGRARLSGGGYQKAVGGARRGAGADGADALRRHAANGPDGLRRRYGRGQRQLYAAERLQQPVCAERKDLHREQRRGIREHRRGRLYRRAGQHAGRRAAERLHARLLPRGAAGRTVPLQQRRAVGRGGAGAFGRTSGDAACNRPGRGARRGRGAAWRCGRDGYGRGARGAARRGRV